MSSSDEEDGCENEDDDVEDWMFQTFTGGKKGGDTAPTKKQDNSSL